MLNKYSFIRYTRLEIILTKVGVSEDDNCYVQEKKKMDNMVD